MLSVGGEAQVGSRGAGGEDRTSSANRIDNPVQADDDGAREELKKGTALTREGQFSAAIPHLQAAYGKLANDSAAGFNLALCYVGTSAFKPAIEILEHLIREGHAGAEVENLLTQAYIGDGQATRARESFQKAVEIAPRNEKLYLFVADACTEHGDFRLGLEVVNTGLKQLPSSARLHYERAMFLVRLDRLDQAKGEFAAASDLAQGGEIGYLARAEWAFHDGDVAGAIEAARAGVAKGFQGAPLLTVLGEGLLKAGIEPGQADFDEAERALERSIAQSPNDAAAQIALGRVCLMAGRAKDAITHLEKARDLQPNEPSIYASLAKAYRGSGNASAAQAALAKLEALNRAQADQINSAPGDRRMSYGGTSVVDEEPSQPHR